MSDDGREVSWLGLVSAHRAGSLPSVVRPRGKNERPMTAVPSAPAVSRAVVLFGRVGTRTSRRMGWSCASERIGAALSTCAGVHEHSTADGAGVLVGRF